MRLPTAVTRETPINRELFVICLEFGEPTLISIKKRDKDTVVKTRPLCAGDLINRKAARPANGQDRFPLSPPRPALRPHTGVAAICDDPL